MTSTDLEARSLEMRAQVFAALSDPIRLRCALDVMSTPALVIDEEVVLAGRVPFVEELRRLLVNHAS